MRPIYWTKKFNMEVLLISIFVLGYLAITLEHTLKIDKLIPALAMMALLWAIVSLAHLPVFEVDTALKKLVPSHIEEILLHHLGKTAEIIIFLLGAMTIVEIIDYFNGFATIKSFIKTKSKKSILWIFEDLSFIMQREAKAQKKLSKAAIETLSIIAYHQPVTRAEIEDISCLLYTSPSPRDS